MSVLDIKQICDLERDCFVLSRNIEHYCIAFRLHWCHEAISVLEEMLNEVYGNDDKMEYHIHDILACAYLQICVVQYEEKVSKSCQVDGKSISDLVQEVSVIGSVDVPANEEDSVSLNRDHDISHDFLKYKEH